MFTPRELGISGKNQRFSMINPLDCLVINANINLVTLGIQSLPNPVIISSVLATFRLTMLVLSQQVRLISSEITASLRSATIFADKVILVSSANILGAVSRKQLGRSLINIKNKQGTQDTALRYATTNCVVR